MKDKGVNKEYKYKGLKSFWLACERKRKNNEYPTWPNSFVQRDKKKWFLIRNLTTSCIKQNFRKFQRES